MSEGIFRSAVFGGFDRQEVLEYIDKMKLDAEEEKQKFGDRIEEINIEKDGMITEYYNMQQKVKTLETHLDEGNKIFDELKDGNRDLINENLKLKTIIDKHRQAGERMAKDFSGYQENMKMKEKSQEDIIRQLESEHEENIKAINYYKEKSERYDKLNENIDEIIRQAKNQTSFLVEKTYEETNKSALEIQKSLEETVLKLEFFKREIGNLKNHLNGYTTEIQNSLNNIDVTVDATLEGIDVDGTKLTQEVVELIEGMVSGDLLGGKVKAAEEKNTSDDIKKQFFDDAEIEEPQSLNENYTNEVVTQISGFGKERPKKSRLVEGSDENPPNDLSEAAVDFNMPEKDLSDESSDALLKKDLKNIEGAMKFPFSTNNEKTFKGNKTYLEDVINEKNKKSTEVKKETFFNSFKFHPKNKTDVKKEE